MYDIQKMEEEFSNLKEENNKRFKELERYIFNVETAMYEPIDTIIDGTSHKWDVRSLVANNRDTISRIQKKSIEAFNALNDRMNIFKEQLEAVQQLNKATSDKYELKLKGLLELFNKTKTNYPKSDKYELKPKWRKLWDTNYPKSYEMGKKSYKTKLPEAKLPEAKWRKLWDNEPNVFDREIARLRILMDNIRTLKAKWDIDSHPNYDFYSRKWEDFEIEDLCRVLAKIFDEYIEKYGGRFKETMIRFKKTMVRFMNKNSFPPTIHYGSHASEWKFVLNKLYAQTNFFKRSREDILTKTVFFLKRRKYMDKILAYRKEMM